VELPTNNYQKYLLMTRTSFVDRCWSFCHFSFGHCIVCSSIYGFFFGIFKVFIVFMTFFIWPLYCLSFFDLWLLITSLVSPCFSHKQEIICTWWNLYHYVDM